MGPQPVLGGTDEGPRLHPVVIPPFLREARVLGEVGVPEVDVATGDPSSHPFPPRGAARCRAKMFLIALRHREFRVFLLRCRSAVSRWGSRFITVCDLCCCGCKVK